MSRRKCGAGLSDDETGRRATDQCFRTLVVLIELDVRIRAGINNLNDVYNRRALVRWPVPDAATVVVGHSAPYPGHRTTVRQRI